jgi:hypothetical protein
MSILLSPVLHGFFVFLSWLLQNFIKNVFVFFYKLHVFFSCLSVFQAVLLYYIYPTVDDFLNIKHRYPIVVLTVSMLDMNVVFAVDNLSLPFIMLVSFILPICYTYISDVKNPLGYIFCFISIQFFLILAFSC